MDLQIIMETGMYSEWDKSHVHTDTHTYFDLRAIKIH